jgi:DNA-directed RNA polymerase specialized sigma24 family protein
VDDVTRIDVVWPQGGDLEAALAPERVSTDDPSARADHDSDLWAALTGLPRRQRAVLVLRYYEDRSDAQIAEILGIAPPIQPIRHDSG